MSQDLLGALAEWRQTYGDIVHLRIWPEHQIVITEPGLVRELLVEHHHELIRWEHGIRVFSQLHGHSVLTAEGDAWKAKRHILQSNFTPKSALSFTPVIANLAAKTYSGWPNEQIDWPIENAFTSLAMDVIMRVMFSSEVDEDARSAEQAVHETAVAGNAEMYWPANWPDWMPWKWKKRRAIAVLDRLITKHIKSRLALSLDLWPEDLLSTLLLLHRQNPVDWPVQAVRDECMTTFLAGHETTAATLTWWARCMAAHPHAQSMARQEVRAKLQGKIPAAEDLASLSYLSQTIQETLRLYPAIPVLLSRRSVRPITLGTWQLPARTIFMVPPILMHHDPRWFPDPLLYKPERFATDAGKFPRGAYIPFGTGPRVCLGQHLAMNEIIIIAAMFLQRFSVKLPAGASLSEPELNISLRPKESLYLTLTQLSE